MVIFNEDPWVSRSLRELGEYSKTELDFLSLIIDTVSTDGPIDLVEAGAYIGDMTIPLARMVRKLYAFEPQVEVRKVLETNLALNDITNVEVLPYALGHEPGVLRYNSVPPESGAGGVMMTESGDIEVQVVTLDSLGISPGLIKADMEGMETMLLGGGLETLGRTRCPLFMEYDTVFLKDGPLLADTLLFLGYNVYKQYFPMFTEDNFNKSPNPFDTTVSKMLYAVPPVGAKVA